MKIYKLSGDYEDNSFFNEESQQGQENIMGLAMEMKWQKFQDYQPVKLELNRSNTGKRNYKFDCSAFLSPFLVFSEQAMEILKPILAPRGQFLDVITDSKRKKFIGYYPTNAYPKTILDLKKSVYEEYPKGLLIRKPVLIKNKIPDDYLFTIEENISLVFVTEKFKQLLEQHHLKGFWFSEHLEIELS